MGNCTASSGAAYRTGSVLDGDFCSFTRTKPPLDISWQLSLQQKSIVLFDLRQMLVIKEVLLYFYDHD